ncbi:MAG: hypothetical protein HRF40_00785 [Nitrososphaera sp.]|jgi:hypothetical protein
MTSSQDGRNSKNSKGRSRAILGLIAIAFMFVAASLIPTIGTAPNYFAASAQLPDGTQQPSTNNTTMASQDSQGLTTVDPMEKAKEASGAVIGVLIFYERAIGATGIDVARITDPNVVIADVTISEIPLGRVRELLAQNDTGRIIDNATQGILQGDINATGTNIVSPADYLVARALAAKAIESFSEASSGAATADPSALQKLAETQQHLIALLSIVDERAPYNLAEDSAATINSNIEQIFGVTAGEIR